MDKNSIHLFPTFLFPHLTILLGQAKVAWGLVEDIHEGTYKKHVLKSSQGNILKLVGFLN